MWPLVGSWARGRGADMQNAEHAATRATSGATGQNTTFKGHRSDSGGKRCM